MLIAGIIQFLFTDETPVAYAHAYKSSDRWYDTRWLKCRNRLHRQKHSPF